MTQKIKPAHIKTNKQRFLLGILFFCASFSFGVNSAYATTTIKILSDSRQAYSSIYATIVGILGWYSDIYTDFVIHSTNMNGSAGFSANPADAIDTTTQRYDQNGILVPSAGPYHIFTTSATGYPGDSFSRFNTYAPYDLTYNYAYSASPVLPSTNLPPIFHTTVGTTSYPTGYGVEWLLQTITSPVLIAQTSLSGTTAINAGVMAVLRHNHSTWNWLDAKAAMRQVGTNWATGYNKNTYGFGTVNYHSANALTDGQILLQPPVASVSTTTGRISFTMYPFKQTRRVKEVLFQFPSAPTFNAGELTLSAIEALGGTKIVEYTGTTATTTTPFFVAITNKYYIWFTSDNATDSAANFSRIDTYSVLGPASQNEVSFTGTFNTTSPAGNAISATQSPTFTWSAADSYLGITKYQLFIDGVLDKDNITGTSATPTSALSAGAHTWYVKAFNGGGATSDTVSTRTINIVPGYTANYTFYVDNVLGSDNNPGTQALPWATLSKAGAVPSAGDSVVIVKNTGVPYREEFTPSKSGTSGSRVTFRGADASTKPEIWGSANISSGWSVYGGGGANTYQYATTTSIQILAVGPSITSLTKKTLGSAAATLNPGEWFWGSNVLYYRLGAGEVMGSIHIEASVRDYGIGNWGASYVTYQNLIIRYTNAIGVYFDSIGETAQGIEVYDSVQGFNLDGSSQTLRYSMAARNTTDGISLNYPADSNTYNSLAYGNGTNGITYSAYTGLTMTLKNNISLGNTDYSFAVGWMFGAPTFTASHNLWDIAGDADWNTRKGTANQELVDPLLVSTSTSNFALTPLSPAIDTGVAISGLTTDILGNPIYGTPDIGPYEYQPPYTIGTHDIDITGGVRLYKNGKYRYTNATTSGTTASMNITPVGGFPTGDYSEFLNLSITTWNKSGDYSKTWTETSTTATSTVHTIGNLKNNTYYDVLVDSTQYTTIFTNGSGQGTFTYSGGYSTHTFNVTESSSTPVAATPATAPTISSSSQTFTWAPASGPAGVAKYQLYADGVLKADDITGTSASATGFSCGTHTWYIRAIDNTGNATETSPQSFDVACGGGPVIPSGSFTFNVPTPRMQTITGGVVTYLDEAAPSSTSPTTTPSVTPSLARTLTKGTKGNDVTALQELLKKDPEIYPEGMITGYYGALTIAAVQRFQFKHGIVTSGDPESTGYGRVGPKTLAKLNEVYGGVTPSPKGILTERLSLGSRGEQVTLLQTGLASDPNIYPEGMITGYYGQLTVAAVQRFQIKYGLGDPTTPGYGGVGPATLAKFNEVFGEKLR